MLDDISSSIVWINRYFTDWLCWKNCKFRSFLVRVGSILINLLNPVSAPSHPYLGCVTKSSVYRGRARLDGHLWKIAHLTPVFLWFCPSICDFGHVHERYWAVWQTGQQRFQCALNHKKTTESLKPEFCPSLRPSNARIFVQKTPVFRPSFYKNEPVWRIGNTDSTLLFLPMTIKRMSQVK